MYLPKVIAYNAKEEEKRCGRIAAFPGLEPIQ